MLKYLRYIFEVRKVPIVNLSVVSGIGDRFQAADIYESSGETKISKYSRNSLVSLARAKYLTGLFPQFTVYSASTQWTRHVYGNQPNHATHLCVLRVCGARLVVAVS